MRAIASTADCEDQAGLVQFRLRPQSSALLLGDPVHRAREVAAPVHEQLLQTVEKMLPPHCRPLIITDAGFRNPWFVEALGWDWVGRIRNRHEVHLSGETRWIPCKSLYPQAASTPKALGRARLTRSNPIDCPTGAL